MTRMELPWPPSINHYFRRSPHGGCYISAEGKTYTQIVAALIRRDRIKSIDGPVAFKCRLHPPNKRRRDLDNSLKVLIDAIAKAGVLGDDYQIKHIEATMLEPVDGGHATVEITKQGG